MASHEPFTYRGTRTCRRCGRWGSLLAQDPACNPPRPLTDDDWAAFAAQADAEATAWASYALDHPDTPVHEEGGHA